ncbi:transposase-like zinc-binding protein [Archangium gephyra]|uniref:Transposase-like zinc-binding protein n=1 Tax=Archangium gephyra TaxID=48 RepID=A0ABX9JKZ4_9BACT|nr:transposase-like zinc-binding protein [Archangium gephyra]
MLYAAVRDNLATLLAEASELGRGLPRYVERDFARYLECGVLTHGFARVRCVSCKDELLVAFSCKGRGVCPSCSAKRAHVTAAHLVERVLPHVPYRQWTLSFPHRVRWVLLKDAGLLSDVLTVFLRAVFIRRTRCSRGSAGRRWTCGPLPESNPGAPPWRDSPCMPTRTFTPTTGWGWSGCAATGRAVR